MQEVVYSRQQALIQRTLEDVRNSGTYTYTPLLTTVLLHCLHFISVSPCPNRRNAVVTIIPTAVLLSLFIYSPHLSFSPSFIVCPIFKFVVIYSYSQFLQISLFYIDE
jgi:hypothetical protein